MKLLGIDFGKRKIGLAYSEGFLASPLAVVDVRTEKQALSEITNVIERLAIERIIIGLSGGVLDTSAQTFGEHLTNQTHIPVIYIDETLTSKEAIKKMIEGKTTQKKRKILEDAVAATIILNTYIENLK